MRALRLCRFDARTNKELADLLEVNPGTMLHHVRTLVDAGFLAPQPERPAHVRRHPPDLRRRDAQLVGQPVLVPPHVLARHLGEGTYVPLGLGVPVPEKLTFDRINFGGIGEFDYSFGDDHGVNSTNANATDSGIGLVLSDWAPFLNKKNPNSTMLGYFSNWVSKQRKSQPGPIEMKAITLQLLSKGRVSRIKLTSYPILS